MSADRLPAAGRPDAGDPGPPLRWWALLLVAPAAWAVIFFAGWGFPPAICDGGGRGWLHAATLVALALAVAGTVGAWRTGRDERDGDEAVPFAALVGALVGGLLALGLVLAYVFVLFIGPCQ